MHNFLTFCYSLIGIFFISCFLPLITRSIDRVYGDKIDNLLMKLVKYYLLIYKNSKYAIASTFFLVARILVIVAYAPALLIIYFIIKSQNKNGLIFIKNTSLLMFYHNCFDSEMESKDFLKYALSLLREEKLR